MGDCHDLWYEVPVSGFLFYCVIVFFYLFDIISRKTSYKSSQRGQTEYKNVNTKLTKDSNDWKGTGKKRHPETVAENKTFTRETRETLGDRIRNGYYKQETRILVH